MKQTRLYKSGVIVHGLLSLYNVISTFPILLQIPSAVDTVEGVPQTVIVLSALLGAVGLVSTYGAWQGQTWGIWLTIVVEVISGLLALPGVLFAPTQALRISAILGVVSTVFVIYALLHRPQVAAVETNEQ